MDAAFPDIHSAVLPPGASVSDQPSADKTDTVHDLLVAESDQD
jgi:hypothetical protein